MNTDNLFTNSNITPEMREKLLDRDIIAHAYESQGSIQRGAASIGVGAHSFRKALALHGVQVRTHGGSRWSPVRKRGKTVKETPLDAYLEAKIYNGRWHKSFTAQLNMTRYGCPYRGTTVCHECPLEPAAVCDWRCRSKMGVYECEHRPYCKCGHDQTERLRSWGLVE